MKNLPTKKMDVLNGEYVNDFEWLAVSLQDRLYRTALILTKSPREAEQLVQETYAHAKQKFHQLEPGTKFGVWISKILIYKFVGKHGSSAQVNLAKFEVGFAE